MGGPASGVGGLTPQRQALLEKLLAEHNIDRPEIRIPRRAGDRAQAPLSFGQERLFLVEQGGSGSAMYVGTGALRLRGEVDVDILRATFAALLERHEVLRTAISDSPATGEVIQRIYPLGEVAFELPVRDVERARLQPAVADAAAQPFDLGRPPLLRPLLLRVTDAPSPESLLVLSMHHIAVDAWSVGVLLREFGVVYRALADGSEPALPELEIGYGDFAAWQRDQLAQGELDDQLAHWRERLDGVPMADLPTDRPRPAHRTYAGGTVPLSLPPGVVSALRTLTEGSGATLFMALIAGWSVVLQRWSGRRDVVVGTPVAGRRRSELESIVGFFVNTLPLRVRVDPRDDFRSLVQRTQEVCLDAYAHQDVPFERIVGELPLERDVSGQTTLARHWLALQNTPPLKASWPGLDAEVLPDLVGTVRCDLSVQLAPARDGGLEGWLEYSTELFDAGTAARLAGALTDVLSAATAAPGSPVVSLAAGADRASLTRLPGPVPPADPGYPDVVRWFEARADATPDAPAVITDDPDDTASFAELDLRANQIAHLLRSRGIGPEDPVGLLLGRGTDLAAAMLGVLKAGAVAMPLVTDQPALRLNRLIEIGNPRLVLASPGQRSAGGRAVVLTGEVLAGQPGGRPGTPSLAPDRAAYLLFTSGSSGLPKGVLCTHGGLLSRLAGMQDSYQLSPADRVLCKAPVGFDVSLWELLLPLVTGAAAVVARPDGQRDVGYLHELIAARGVTIAHFVPSLLEEFAQADGPDAPGLRLLLSGGERLSRPLAERVLARWPKTRFVNQYGPTETVIDVTAGDVIAPVPGFVPIGRPVPGTEILLLDEFLRPVPTGVPGELYVGGAQVARCYIGAPEVTATRFVAHPLDPGRRLYATGDRARWLADGSLDFLGRTDDQVKIRGHRIELGEVEAVLRESPDAADALVRARPDDAGQPQLVAYVVAPGAQEDLQSRLAEFLADRLPAAAVPSHVVVLAQWPVNANGKIDIAALPGPTADAGTREEPPRGDTEKQLAEVWAELLNADRVGRTASFAALGGHSLLALRAIARIRSAFGVRIKIGEFLGAADLASLAALIGDRMSETAADADDDAPIPRIDRGDA